ncbi:oxygenase MpaB family protein, partial [Alcanivorax sp. 1008]|uniref:oxygenase MpaB family protein n=1 Tax=Alcanivorax sp. 1008 TaxID=2816853 RepID=UPI001DDBD1A4
RGDPAADNLARAMRANRSLGRELDAALRQGVGPDTDVAAEVADFVRSAVQIPDFIDRQKVTEGGRVFRSKLDLFGLITYGLPVGIYLQGMVPAITMALLFTNRPTKVPATIEQALARKESKRRGFVRVLETFRWFNAVAESGAGDLYSDEFRENCKIRLVHGHIRGAIRGHQEPWNYQPPLSWDEAELGVPMSAADGSIVVATIMVTMLAMRRHLHKPISDQELEALNHWINYVSFLQGVPEELLCKHWQDTATQLAAFILSMDPGTCHAPLRSFMTELQDLGLGRGLFGRIRPLARLLDAVGTAALSQVFDAEIRTHYGLRTASTGERATYALLHASVSMMNRAAGFSAALNRGLDGQTVKLWRTIMPEAERILSRLHGRVVE